MMHFICCRSSVLKNVWSEFCGRAKLSQTPIIANCNAENFQKMAQKLREKTPLSKLNELNDELHPHQEKEPLKPFPNGVNPVSGEKNGPKGPEPTRYGDWERKGRVTDF